MSRKNPKDRATDFEAYVSSRESLWFWLSYALISAFFIFSLITTENTLILFIKRATTLLFVFLIPGYVITKAIYPKNDIDAIERFAFSVAFSVTFVMFTVFLLNYVGINHFSLVVTTFPLALIFTIIAVLRSYRSYKQKPDSVEKNESNFREEVIPLALIGLLVFLIKIYGPLTEPRAGFIDQYLFTIYTQNIISSGAALTTVVPFSSGYVPGYFFVIAFLKFFLDTGVYEIMRYAHVFSFLTVIPAYLFARHVFKSRRIALLAIAFMFSTRWMFMRTSISNPESMSHFLVILFLFMLLKTIENPNVKNFFVTSLLLSSAVLEYHMTFQFLVPFITVIFIFLGIRHLFTKTGPALKEIIKTAFLTVTPAVLISGFLWYFWNLGRFFYGLPATDYLTRGHSTRFLFDENLFVELAYHVRNIGLFEVIFLCAGLILIVLNIEQRKNIRYQFLLIYFIVILFLIQSKFFGISYLHIRYLFAWLAFPASMLAGYGFFSSMKAIHARLIKPGINLPSPKIFLAIGIVLILLVNFNGFNYHWYKHDAYKVYRYDEQIALYPSTYKDLQKSVNETGFLSSYLYRALYGFYYPISITFPEYEAFKEIKEHTTPDSRILLWKCKKEHLTGISERKAWALEDLGIEPDYDSTQILKEILRINNKYYNFAPQNRFMIVGLTKRFPYVKCPEFSNETLISLPKDPNFKLVYENEQIKIYKILAGNYSVFLDKPGGFREDFEDLFYWGTDLKEINVLRTDGDLATYRAMSDDQSIDADFSTGLDTRIYPYFETRMNIDGGKIHIGVYDSTGKEHMFLKNYTTNGEWETYKFNLYDWLTGNRYETEIYGIKITNTLEGDAFFSSSFDWMSIHNHIFSGTFEDERKIANMDGIAVTNGSATLSKKTVGILNNSGFENDFEGWRPRAKWSIDSTSFHSGNKSAILRGTAADMENDPDILLDTEIYPGILMPNMKYRFSAWTRGNVTDAVRGTIRQYGSVDPWSNWVYFTQRKNYDNWTYAEGIITMPGDVNGDFYVRIHGGGNPAVWIDDVSLAEDVYASSGMLTSITTITENPLVSVTPTWSSVEPDKNINVTIEISVDNATTWTRAENGAAISYPVNNANKYLLYRAYFQTNDAFRSPILDDITITYEERQ